MSELKVTIVPSTTSTTIEAVAHARLILHARLPPTPWHQKALPMLLESLGHWHHLPVRAALVVGAKEASCVTKLYPEWFTDFGGRAYALEIVDRRGGDR
jgi:hypothetical protein